MLIISEYCLFVLFTFYRPEQEAELTRLGQTLLHVTRLTWIIVEDYRAVTDRLKHILQKFPSLNIVLMAGNAEIKYKYMAGHAEIKYNYMLF